VSVNTLNINNTHDDIYIYIYMYNFIFLRGLLTPTICYTNLQEWNPFPHHYGVEFTQSLQSMPFY
jgi:hypothetical protein